MPKGEFSKGENLKEQKLDVGEREWKGGWDNPLSRGTKSVPWHHTTGTGEVAILQTGLRRERRKHLPR